MNAGEEYQAHNRRSEGRYVLAHEDWEKGLAPVESRLIRLAVMPNIEDTRHKISRRVSMGMALNAAESVPESCFYGLAEKLDRNLEEPSPELLAEMLGSTVPVLAVFFKWHERPAARKAGRNKIVHTAVFLDRVKSRLSGAELACPVDLSLTAARIMKRNYASMIACSMPIAKNSKFWQCELELLAASNRGGAEKIFAIARPKKPSIGAIKKSPRARWKKRRNKKS
jgi:hypothetical protein